MAERAPVRYNAPQYMGERRLAHKDEILTARELAAYLKLNDRTILRLASDGTLPGVKVASQWRFRRSLIDRWLNERMGDAPELDEDDVGSPPDLGSVIRPEYVAGALSAQDRDGVVRELSALAGRLGLVQDVGWLAGALLERERILSTALEGALAVLHTRHRNQHRFNAPFILIGRSPGGVPFGAQDGSLTRIFFLFSLRTDRDHLHWMQRVASLGRSREKMERILAVEDLHGGIVEALNG